MALTDWQLELGGLTLGAGTVYQLGAASIQGLGNPKAKTADFELDQQDGAAGAPDYLGVRSILIPIEILESDAAAAFTALGALKTAWMPTTGNVELHLKLPGHDEVFWDGRPREVEADIARAKSGCITCILHFEALDPTAQNA